MYSIEAARAEVPLLSQTAGRRRSGYAPLPTTERQRERALRAYSRRMDLTLIEAHLAVAEEHIAQGERHVARQRELVGLLCRGGYDTTAARALLQTFEQSQAMHLADRDRLRKELEEAR